MEVLKKGRPQIGRTFKIVCSGSGNGGGGCGALLLVGEGDLFQTSHTDMGGETEYFTTFECPECKVLTDTKNFGSYRAQDHAEWLKKHAR